MSLKITSRDVEGVTVLSLAGRIVLGEETAVLREAVGNQIAQGKTKLVFDMNEVTMIDSSGLGALVAAYSSAKRNGASLRLCNLGAHFNELLQITKLLTIFDVSRSQAEAVHSFAKAESTGA